MGVMINNDTETNILGLGMANVLSRQRLYLCKRWRD